MTAATERRSWEIQLTGPAFTMNQRLHRRRRDEYVATWRDMAHQKAIAVFGAKRPQLERSRILVFWHPFDRRRRDPLNIAPIGKAVVDGLVRAGVLVDDSAEHVEGPDFRMGPALSGRPLGDQYVVTVRIEVQP